MWNMNNLSSGKPVRVFQTGVVPLLMFLAYFGGDLKGMRCREAFLATFRILALFSEQNMSNGTTSF
jgi:hypothetical protein